MRYGPNSPHKQINVTQWVPQSTDTTREKTIARQIEAPAPRRAPDPPTPLRKERGNTEIPRLLRLKLES